MNKSSFVIGAVVLVLVLGYYFFSLQQKNSHMPSSQAGGNTQATTAQTNPPATGDSIYSSKSDPVKGNYMADPKGMTLYTFDKDTTGVSNCYGGCAQAWPPYSSGTAAQAGLPASITVVKRTDGTSQFAWKGMPLYYYATDQKAGDVTGDGVGGVWHIVKL